MLGVLTNLFTILGCSGLCYILFLALKLTVVILICRHPELSDDKVKYITNMIAKRRQQSNWSILIFMPLYLTPLFFWYNCALKYDNAFWAQFYTKNWWSEIWTHEPFREQIYSLPALTSCISTNNSTPDGDVDSHTIHHHTRSFQDWFRGRPDSSGLHNKLEEWDSNPRPTA